MSVRLVNTGSRVRSSAVCRGAGRDAEELLPLLLAAGSAGLFAGAGSTSALSRLGALGIGNSGNTVGVPCRFSPVCERSRISGTLHSPVLNVCPSSCRLLPCRHAGHNMFMTMSSGSLHSTGTRVCFECTRVQFRWYAWQMTPRGCPSVVDQGLANDVHDSRHNAIGHGSKGCDS